MKSIRNNPVCRSAALVAVIMSCTVAYATVRTNTIVNGASNWNDPNSYTDKSFVPGPNDYVIIPAGASVSVSSTDTTSFNIVSNLAYICITDKDSTMTFDIAEGHDVLIGCKFKLLTPGIWKGRIVKKGKGRLTAGDGSKYPLGVDWSYYAIPLRVEEGECRCAQGINPGNNSNTTGKSEYYSGGVEIWSNAVFRLGSGNFLCTGISGLWGDGTITTPGGTRRQLRVLEADAWNNKPSTFGGVLDSGVEYFSRGRVFLTGTNSTMTSMPTVFGAYKSYATNNGYTAVMKFGNEGQPSSIGVHGILDINARGGGWGYLGTGETTSKTFRWFPNTDGPSLLLDGGAHGGLVFAGQWRSAGQGIGSIVLTGSNTVSACVVDCPIQTDANDPYSGRRSPVSIIKTGTGKWRFTHKKSRHLLGVFDIQQGTIQADSLEEAGVQSALGYATNLFLEGYSNTTDTWPSDKRTPGYAFVLGAEASDSIAGKATEGTLEYTGTNSAYCFTRPFVLDGDARFKNSTAKNLWLGRVSSRSAGAKTLMLDGDSARTNLIADITDAGGGAVSLAKEGSGTWIVTGTNDIRGNITVKAGTLILQNVNGLPYTWHRWVIRRNHAQSTDSAENRAKIRPSEFGLFNSNGTRVNKGLTYCRDYTDIEPGQVAVGTFHLRYGRLGEDDPSYLTRLFDGKSDAGGPRFRLKTDANKDQPFDEGNPDTWQVVMMRLAAGTEAASWDYANEHGSSNSSADKRTWVIRSSALYGSANGANWEFLADAPDVPSRTYENYWAFDGRGISNHTNCNTIASRVQGAYPFLGNMAGAVSVAPGATLECQGAPVTFSKLALDAAGAGTIRGAAFAASGEISVANVTTKDDIVFSGLFDGCATAANVARWTVRENGQVTTRRRTLVRGGDLRLVRKGICMNFR